MSEPTVMPLNAQRRYLNHTQRASAEASTYVEISRNPNMRCIDWTKTNMGPLTHKNSRLKDIKSLIKAPALSPGSAKATRQQINKSKLKARAPRWYLILYKPPWATSNVFNDYVAVRHKTRGGGGTASRETVQTELVDSFIFRLGGSSTREVKIKKWKEISDE